MRTTTDKSVQKHLLDAMNAICVAATKPLSDLDAIEVQQIQKQLARLIERNGMAIERMEDKTYTLTGKPVNYEASTGREALAEAIDELIRLLGPDWETTPNGLGKVVWNARKLRATLIDPNATGEQLSKSLMHCTNYIGWLKEK